MELRMVLAVVLSAVVMVGYYALFPAPVHPPQPKRAVETESVDKRPATPRSQTSANPALAPAPASAQQGRAVTVNTPLYAATFNTAGGVLTSFTLRDYRRHKPQISWQSLFAWLPDWLGSSAQQANGPVQLVENHILHQRLFDVSFPNDLVLDEEVRNLVYQPSVETLQVQPTRADSPASHLLRLTANTRNGMRLEKRFYFDPHTYVLRYELTLQLRENQKPRMVRVVSAFGDGPGNVTEYAVGFGRHSGPLWFEDGALNAEDAVDIASRLLVRNPQWMGVADSYFISVAKPETPINHGFYESYPAPTAAGRDAAYGFEYPQTVLSVQRPIAMQATAYLGPKRPADMMAFDTSLEAAEDLMLSVLAGPMLNMLRWLNGYTANYGWAIIILTIIVRVLLFPLTYKGMVAMKRLQLLQPKFKAIREKYSDKKDRMNKELMELYRRNKVNPLGGCLPVLAQIPIFFALYSALMGAIELRHAPFLFWLTDLSVKDPLFILPILMGASMFAQQLMMPATLDPMQRRVMLLMPLVFLVFTFNFPSGLVLYWFVSNMLSIGQQLIINRIKVSEST